LTIVFDVKWKKIAADINLEGSSKNKQWRAKISLFYKTLIILYNIYYTQLFSISLSLRFI